MFGLTLIAVYALLLIYVLGRATSMPLIRRRLSGWRLVAAGAALAALFVLARVYGRHATGPVALWLERIGMLLLGAAFLLALPLLVMDLATGFGRLLGRWRQQLRAGALVAGALLVAIALVQGTRAPAVVRYEVALPGLPPALDGKLLVALSDTHIGRQLGGDWLEARIAQVQQLKPDLVVFLGDIFEGHGVLPGDLPALRQLPAALGKWYVLGNHELHHEGGAIEQLLERGGFRRLDNDWAAAAPGLMLGGVNDLTHHKRRGLDGDPLGKALARKPAGATVFLSHTPWQAERVARAGVGLMLSGHTHGGQIWPLGYLVQTRYPLLAGRYELDGMTAIVSRGTGTWGPRMRLWRRGEILAVTLRAARE